MNNELTLMTGNVTATVQSKDDMTTDRLEYIARQLAAYAAGFRPYAEVQMLLDLMQIHGDFETDSLTHWTGYDYDRQTWITVYIHA